MGKWRAAAILLLIMASAAFSSWTESVEVHAVDAKNRPLKGAVVEVRYQKNAFPVSEGSLDGRFSLTTDESGKVAVNFGNNVKNSAYETRYYFLSANYSGEYQSEKITCTSLGSKCHEKQPFLKTFFMDAYRINVKVEDQNGEPIGDAAVKFGETEYNTDSNGKVWINAINGKSYSIVVEYKGKRRTAGGKISGADADVIVVIPRYDLRFRVVNDNGKVIPADVLLNGTSKNTDEDGYVSFENIISDNIQLFVRYETGFKNFNISLTGNIDTEIVIDENPPLISQVDEKVDEKQKAIFVSAGVRDPGSKGSGLREIDPVRLRYKSGSEGWSSISMYQTGREAYEATIPLVYDTIINYEIEAFDAQGNGQSYTDSIIVKSGGELEKEVKNETEVKKEKPKERGEVDIITLVAGVIILIVILLIIYKKYTGEI